MLLCNESGNLTQFLTSSLSGQGTQEQDPRSLSGPVDGDLATNDSPYNLRTITRSRSKQNSI
jgi:hypothetical protein